MAANRAKIPQYYGDDPHRAAEGLFTDAVFLAPPRRLAAAQMEKVNQPAHLYFFSYVAKRRGGRSPSLPHGGEIPFVSDDFPGILKPFPTPADRVMADTVSSARVQFAKTGIPIVPAFPSGRLIPRPRTACSNGALPSRCASTSARSNSIFRPLSRCWAPNSGLTPRAARRTLPIGRLWKEPKYRPARCTC